MKKISLVIILALCALSARGQGVLNVRINEVLVVNQQSIVDDYGMHDSWVELFNTGYESVDVGGCWLAVRHADRFDAEGNKLISKYLIPRSGAGTAMPPLSYKVFYCEGTGTKGAFYTNFTLDGDVDMVLLYDASGREVISAFKMPVGYVPVADVSLGLVGHEEPESFIFPKVGAAERRTLTQDRYLDRIAAGLKHQPEVLERSTPGATNDVDAETPRHELFRRSDPYGIVMSAIAMIVVFGALILIFWVIKLFGKAMMARTSSRETKSIGEPVVDKKSRAGYSAEEVAAIGLALRLYQDDLHVEEAKVITINRVGRMYSPWNSKIYNISELPPKK